MMTRRIVKVTLEIRNPDTQEVITSDSVVYEAKVAVLKNLPMSQAVQEMINEILLPDPPGG